MSRIDLAACAREIGKRLDASVASRSAVQPKPSRQKILASASAEEITEWLRAGAEARRPDDEAENE